MNKCPKYDWPYRTATAAGQPGLRSSASLKSGWTLVPGEIYCELQQKSKHPSTVFTIVLVKLTPFCTATRNNCKWPFSAL